MIPPGTRLGAYEVTALIGVGGMGEVYRARDTRVNRSVAIKLTSEEFGGHFEREARAIAALNHPNVCQLYDVGPNYLVMEFVDGSPIAHVDSPQKVLEFAVQLADGLAAAHAAGIVHRDLKPANILITGRAGEQRRLVKILDFGIATLGRVPAVDGQLDTAATTSTTTTAGALVGTIAYMSPEQARGETMLTPQSDQFSIGVILYELATGRHPFRRATAAETLTAIMREDAPPLPTTTPTPLRWIIERLLAKDPLDRYDSTRDLYKELRLLTQRASEGERLTANPPVRHAQRRWRLAVATLAALAVSLAGFIVGTQRASAPATSPAFMNVGVDVDGVRSPSGVNVALSPDGSRVAFLTSEGGTTHLAVRTLHDARAARLAGSDGAFGTVVFSADGQSIAFTTTNGLMKIPVAGGTPTLITDAPIIAGATWNRRGTIVAPIGSRTQVATQTSLSMVPDSGGAPQLLVPLADGEVTHRFPQFLPDDEHVIYTANHLLDQFDDAVIRLASVNTREVKTIVRGAYYARYLPSGHLLFMRGGVLYGVKFDLAALETRGEPVPLLQDVDTSTAWGLAQMAVSASGTLVYRHPPAAAWPLVWLERTGGFTPLLSAPGQYYTPRLSPSRTAIAFSSGLGAGDISVYEWQRDKTTRLTSDGQGHFSPVWTPDGQHVVYRTYSAASGEYALDVVRADGSGEPQRLVTSKRPLLPGDISTTGHLAYTQGEDRYDIWTVALDLRDPDQPRVGEPVLFLRTPANELQPVFSPDSKWIAHVSNANQRSREVYVRPFPAPASGADRRWQVSVQGGEFPVWSRDGTLFFARYGRSGLLQVYSVSYTTSGDNFVPERPVRWVDQAFSDTDGFRSLDFDAAGERFAVAPPPDAAALERARRQLSLLVNFSSEVARRVP